jgi:leucyl aminopeptidase (aminopeptidase T)
MDNKIRSAAQVAVKTCMGIKNNEKVLVITDAPCREIGYALFESSCEITKNTTLCEITPRERNGSELEPEIAQLMTKYDVIFGPASKSFSHTETRRNASNVGVRIATLPGITLDSFTRCMDIDYNIVKEKTAKLAKLLQGNLIRVKTDLGTDITFPIKGIKCHEDTGFALEKGMLTNLPAGEAYMMLEEGKSNGTIIFDGSLGLDGILKNPIKITVKNGFAVEINGKEEALQFRKYLENFGKLGEGNLACAVAEFGVGTNYAAKITGSMLEDEKAFKTIHIAFGDNRSMGGTIGVSSHIDGLVKNPNFWVDDKKLMEKGELLGL